VALAALRKRDEGGVEADVRVSGTAAHDGTSTLILLMPTLMRDVNFADCWSRYSRCASSARSKQRRQTHSDDGLQTLHVMSSQDLVMSFTLFCRGPAPSTPDM
jgi:hypothetical protein